MALLPAAWADEVLRDRQDNLTPAGLEKMVLLATGNAEAANDVRSERIRADMRQGKPIVNV